MDKLSVSHSCGESALKCVDCNEQVCPKCFVQCAVGNRCKKCAGRFTSHVLKAPPAVLIRLGLTMAGVGLAYGFLSKKLGGIGFGFYGYFIEFFIFLALGRVLHRVASYKQGVKVLGSAVLGLVVGLALSPAREMVLTAINAGGAADYMLSEYLISLGIMCVGVLAPYFRKG